MIYIIDHQDSFTWNVVHQFSKFEEVYCSNYFEINQKKLDQSNTIVLSPGPGSPKDYPFTSKIYKKYKGKKKLIGNCLGYQQILFNEKLNFKDNYFDYYSISFGLRNTNNINHVLQEAYRVLRPGGRFICLEFSKIKNYNFKKLYDFYSKSIPRIGNIVVGDDQPYEYLVKSIKNFYNQGELIDLMKKNNFYKSEYRNLSGGIVAIHSGWKI